MKMQQERLYFINEDEDIKSNSYYIKVDNSLMETISETVGYDFMDRLKEYSNRPRNELECFLDDIELQLQARIYAEGIDKNFTILSFTEFKMNLLMFSQIPTDSINRRLYLAQEERNRKREERKELERVEREHIEEEMLARRPRYWTFYQKEKEVE